MNRLAIILGAIAGSVCVTLTLQGCAAREEAIPTTASPSKVTCYSGGQVIYSNSNVKSVVVGRQTGTFYITPNGSVDQTVVVRADCVHERSR